MKELIFKDWESLWHVAACAAIGYISLFVFIRISGKRTLSKLNAFDFVVAVTLGSTLSSMILGKVTIAEGLVAVAVIIGLQFLLAYFARKDQTLERLINSEPTILYFKGRYIESAMQREVITQEEIYAAVRHYRIHDMDQVEAVVMELNGELVVIRSEPGATNTSMDDIFKKQGSPDHTS